MTIENERQALLPTYAPPDIRFTRGEGPYLYTEDGEAYLDFINGIAVNAFGHCHPHLVNALKQQAETLWHTSNIFRVPAAEHLAKRLTELTFADKVFFTNSGAEAVECGLKMMRRYHYDNGNPERYRIIGTGKAFHGRTIATIAVAGNPSYTKGFVHNDQGYDHVGFNDIAAIESAISDETAGIIVEPIQGEGGINVVDKEYLAQLREICDTHNLVLMFDEVQCGVGRTGKLYAYEWFDVVPDIMASAKGLGGGFPVGACLANDTVAAPMVVGTHGSTFGGNPLAMSVANAVLDLATEPGLLQSVQQNSALLKAQLEQLTERYPAILESVRGMGYMLGIRCKVENGAVINALRDAKLLTGKADDNVVRLLPALNITSEHIAEAIEKIEGVLKSW